MAPRTVKSGPMCCVIIDYQEYLLPMDKGMRLVELMSHAVPCNLGYDESRTTYHPKKDAPEVSMRTVNPNQVRAAREPSAPLLLGND